MAGDLNVTGLFALFTIIKINAVFLSKTGHYILNCRSVRWFSKFLEKHLVMFRRKHYLNNLSS